MICQEFNVFDKIIKRAFRIKLKYTAQNQKPALNLDILKTVFKQVLIFFNKLSHIKLYICVS